MRTTTPAPSPPREPRRCRPPSPSHPRRRWSSTAVAAVLRARMRLVQDPTAAPTTTPPVSYNKTLVPAATPTTPATPAPAAAPTTPALATAAPPLPRSRLSSLAPLSTILGIPVTVHAEPPPPELGQPASLACSAAHLPVRSALPEKREREREEENSEDEEEEREGRGMKKGVRMTCVPHHF
uniref:Uncharacterized protein n=1 Tax=Oryza sativa subsp. japonica TaxID=39947 RepID=Q2QQM1_ORYSJ|nr:hypothetical protein LOC_Os12g30560 [Oryza sativa Japonica Group]